MAGKLNRIGLENITYKGSKTTLCAGCGHNSISERIIDAFFEMGIDPEQVVKLRASAARAGVFPRDLAGFNAVHGLTCHRSARARSREQKLLPSSAATATGAIGIGNSCT
jgi:2-oxoglutarate ferredoxin oxidoreductase subunit beta